MSGVTIKPALHLASSTSNDWPPGKSALHILSEIHFYWAPGMGAEELARRGYGFKPKEGRQIIQSSIQAGTETQLRPDRNGFVHSAITAYSSHHHLKIRPDDVWLAILTQLSSYVNAHAEELRGSLVAHKGKKKLEIVCGSRGRFNADWGDFASKIGVMIQENVVDPELREWIMPAFSTTTHHDTVIASIVMMAGMQSYFEYGASMVCGLPSITLLGEKANYEIILQRLPKLCSYGKEPTEFAALLIPVIKRFIQSFEDPNADKVKDFWNCIVTKITLGSGMPYYSGWITAFVFWDNHGKALHKEGMDYRGSDKLRPISLDGVGYHHVSTMDVPPGFCTVPVEINDNGHKIEAEMLAGSIGWDCTSSGGETASGKGEVDTVQPRSGWCIYDMGA